MKISLKILSLSLVFSLNAATGPSADDALDENTEAVSTQAATEYSSVTEIDAAVGSSLANLFPSLRSLGSDEQIAQNICDSAHAVYEEMLQTSSITEDLEIPRVIRELTAFEAYFAEKVSAYEKNKEGILRLGNKPENAEKRLTPEQYEDVVTKLNDIIGATRVLLAQNQFDRITKRNARNQSSLTGSN
ncbi:MAG: hypothetical protein ACK4V2_05865 [Pseudomonadota bacterium]|jgi:hypothetical protein|nr:hypothetical protein [Alphaproteobacteria bacterium]